MPTFQQRYQKALAAISDRDWPAAEVILRDLADSSEPMIPQVGYNLALVLREMGRVSDFATWLLRVLDAVPDHRDARFELAALQMNQGELESALGNFRRCIDATPEDSDALKNGGMLAVRLGQWQEAENWLDRCLALCPDDPDAQLARANLARETGDMERAEAIYRRLFRNEIPMRPLILKSMIQNSMDTLPLDGNGLPDKPEV